MNILLVYERELLKNDYHRNPSTNNNYKNPQKDKKKKLSKSNLDWRKSYYFDSGLRIFRCNVRYIGCSSLSPGSLETQQGWS